MPDNNLTGRTTITSYQDSFSDSTANNTLAYPTTITDPDNNQSKLQYRYDIGAVTRTQDPKMLAADATKGIVSKYDALGRLTRVDNQFSTGYALYYYDIAFYWTLTYTKADEAGNLLPRTTVHDGYGRLIADATQHPNSTGGQRLKLTRYDTMGRLETWTNPAEMNGAWFPAGDDAAGWVWSTQTYDWKGRPKVRTNQDGSTKSYEYGGCGCTGEATVTVTDEVGRKTRTISDAFLDHTMQVNKTEVLAMDGVTVYATTAQVTKPVERKSYVLEVAGATTDYSACANGNCNSATRRQTTTTYNGLGQALQRQVPQQSGTTPYTAYEYYADGSLKKSTDARGAYAMLNYNKRGLTTSINYTVPGGVEATPNVSFSYDANGNRETMTDGVGSVDYMYDTLSRLLSETRTFTGLSGSFALSYEYYNSTGQLKKITDPFGDSISYEYDLAGRTRNITGSAFAGVTSYVTNINYRAWGGTKSLTSDNGTSTATMGYNSLMRLNNFQMGSINVNYSYYADGRLYQSSNPSNAKLNQTFNWYDPFGRVTHNGALSDANAQQFYQNLFYDALGHQTYRYGRHWWMPEYINGNANTFQNNYQFTNHKITSGWEQSGVNQSQQTVTTTYDNEGNTLTSYAGTTPGHTMMYDAASRITCDAGTGAQENFYDGDGALVKDYYVVQFNPTFIDGYKYHLRSSLLGGEIVTTLDYQGAKAETSVYGNGQLLAVQKAAVPAQSIPAEVKFNHRDPHYTIDFSNPADLYWIDAQGTPGKAADAVYITQYQTSQNHPDPATVAAGSSVFYANALGAIAPNSGLNCKMDGALASCDSVLRGISRGHASRVNISLPGLVGDVNTQALVTSFSLAASTRNGQPTGGGARIIGWRKVVIPGVAQQTMAARFESGEAISLGEVDPGSKDIVGYDAIWGDADADIQGVIRRFDTDERALRDNLINAAKEGVKILSANGGKNPCAGLLTGSGKLKNHVTDPLTALRNILGALEAIKNIPRVEETVPNGDKVMRDGSERIGLTDKATVEIVDSIRDSEGGDNAGAEVGLRVSNGAVSPILRISLKYGRQASMQSLIHVLLHETGHWTGAYSHRGYEYPKKLFPNTKNYSQVKIAAMIKSKCGIPLP